MSKETESGEEKTEDPSGRRLSEARKDGNVCKSQEISMVTSMVAAFLALRYISPYMWQDLKLVTSGAFTSRYSFEEPITPSAMQQSFLDLVMILGPELFAIMVITAIFGAGVTALQTKFLWTTKTLKFDLKKLNPVAGMKRIFSLRNSVGIFKAIAKLCIICPIAYFAFFDLFPQFLRLMDVPVQDLLPFTAFACDYVFWKIIYFFAFLAILDYAYNYWEWYRQIQMSKTEVKEEQKSIEGDAKTKNRIKAAGMTRLRQQILQSVPEADVVVTNPTHFAVALKYDLVTGGAPMVIAKGQDHLALRIKEIAKEHKIPVIERKPLARALFKTVEIGQEIPYELFKAVAELLAYVYRIKGKNPLLKRANSTETN